MRKYNHLLEEFLKATITSLVVIKQSPVITWDGSSPILILAGIAGLSVILTIALLSVQRLLEKARG
jgi:hypothetical protein